MVRKKTKNRRKAETISSTMQKIQLQQQEALTTISMIFRQNKIFANGSHSSKQSQRQTFPLCSQNKLNYKVYTKAIVRIDENYNND